MILPIEVSQTIADSFCGIFGLPKVEVIYKDLSYLNAWGLYEGTKVFLEKTRPRLATLLHEIAHHVQNEENPNYRCFESVHGASYQKAIRKVVKVFREAYGCERFIYFSGKQILEPKRRKKNGL